MKLIKTMTAFGARSASNGAGFGGMKMKTLPGTTVRITYADGTPDTVSTYRGALGVVASRYSVKEETLVTEENGERMLIWLSEDDAKDDAGEKAVAEVRPVA